MPFISLLFSRLRFVCECWRVATPFLRGELGFPNMIYTHRKRERRMGYWQQMIRMSTSLIDGIYASKLWLIWVSSLCFLFRCRFQCHACCPLPPTVMRMDTSFLPSVVLVMMFHHTLEKELIVTLCNMTQAFQKYMWMDGCCKKPGWRSDGSWSEWAVWRGLFSGDKF